MALYRTEGVVDESAVRYPFVVEEPGIINEGIKIGGREFSDVLLLNGERMLIEGELAVPIAGDFGKTVSGLIGGMGDERKALVVEELESILREGLHYPPEDSAYWTRALLANDIRFEALFPHWLHNAIITALSLPDTVYRAVPPFFSRITTVPTFGSGRSINEEELCQPPIQVAINIPCFSGEFNGGAIDPDTVLMRKSGDTGEYVFPGGHARAIYEPTAMREFSEEVHPSISYSDSIFGDRQHSVHISLKRVSLVGVIDQFRFLQEERVQRYRSYVYRNIFITADEYWHSLPVGDLASLTNASIKSLDRVGTWSVVPLALLYNSDYYTDYLSDITREILVKQRDFLAPKRFI